MITNMSPITKTIKESISEVRKRFWYDTTNLTLRRKDVPCYDEDDKLLGYSQNAAVVPSDIEELLLQSQIKVIEAVQQQLRDSQWECPEHGLPEFSITECLECKNALSINVILQDQISSLNETLEFLKRVYDKRTI